MASAARDCFSSFGFSILDGGLATSLESRGNDINNSLWSASLLVTKPTEVAAVHAAFIAAGADVITTASYQLSAQGFENQGIPTDWRSAALLSVRLAKEACKSFIGRVVLVGGSIGPLGAVFHDGSEYTGWYGLPSEGPVVPVTAELKPGRQDLASIIAFHRPRAEALIEGGCDFLAFETIPCVVEAQAIARLVTNELSRRVPCWISFQCRDGATLASGEKLVSALDAIGECDPEGTSIAVGVNCVEPSIVLDCIRTIKGHPSGSKRRVVVYPNRGEVWCAETGRWEARGRVTPSEDEFVALAKQWKAAGAWGIGGCCRVGPELIKRLKEELKEDS